MQKKKKSRDRFEKFIKWTEFLVQDLHSVDLEEFKHGGTNITAFRLVDPEKQDIQKVVQDWIYGEKRYNRELDMGQSSNKVGWNIIYVYVASYYLLIRTVAAINRVTDFRNVPAISYSARVSLSNSRYN